VAAPPPSETVAATAPTGDTDRGKRALGVVEQVAAVIGIGVSIALIVVVLWGRGWLVDQTDKVSGTVDGALAQSVTLVDNASTRVSDVSGRVAAVVDAANALVANPNPAPGLSEALSAQLQPIQDRYLVLRSAYTDVKTTVVSAYDRLQTLDQMLPFFSIPQGPVDSLTSLDSKLQDIDGKVTDLFTTPGSGAVNAIAAGVATRAANLQTGLESVTTTLHDVSVRITTLQANVQAKADQVRQVITVATVLLVLLFLYLAFLHWVLFRTGSRLRRLGSAE